MKKTFLLISMVMLLAALPLAAADINLRFEDPNPAGTIVGYKAYTSTAGVTGPFALNKTQSGSGAGGDTVNMTLSLSPGLYWIRVTAYNSWTESEPSNTVSTGGTAPPSAPSDLEFVILIKEDESFYVLEKEQFFRSV